MALHGFAIGVVTATVSNNQAVYALGCCGRTVDHCPHHHFVPMSQDMLPLEEAIFSESLLDSILQLRHLQGAYQAAIASRGIHSSWILNFLV